MMYGIILHLHLSLIMFRILPISRIEKVIGFVLMDHPTDPIKPFYLHLICTEKGYTGLGDYLMKQVKLIAKGHPILLHSDKKLSINFIILPYRL